MRSTKRLSRSSLVASTAIRFLYKVVAHGAKEVRDADHPYVVDEWLSRFHEDANSGEFKVGDLVLLYSKEKDGKLIDIFCKSYTGQRYKTNGGTEVDQGWLGSFNDVATYGLNIRRIKSIEVVTLKTSTTLMIVFTSARIRENLGGWPQPETTGVET